MVSSEALLTPDCSPEAQPAVEANFLRRLSRSPILGWILNAASQSSLLSFPQAVSAFSLSSSGEEKGFCAVISPAHTSEPEHLKKDSRACSLSSELMASRLIVCTVIVLSVASPNQ